MIAIVKRLACPPPDDAGWNKPPWREISPELIGNFMGEKPDHFPKTEVKIAYENAVIHLMFRVEDRYVRAIAAEHQDSVCGDSCVEFFFTPGSDVSKGYFNLEMNCGGTMLFHFHPGAGNGRIEILRSDCEKIKKTNSLPCTVDPEIQGFVTWSVAYSLPIALLRRYCQVSTPKPQVLWRANFYKCADNTSHPHWLTWSPVDCPKPNFHLPQSFGFLEFE
ncbi:MAG: carbohydrate-binding family 9-like protein [Syntrophales bacterium]